MRKCNLIPVIAGTLIACNAAFAQTEASGPDTDFRTRTSVCADWKIVKGLHLNGGYELGTAGSFSRINRHKLMLGIEYSPIKHLEIGGGYYYLGDCSKSGESKPKNRFYVDITGSFKAGNWKFSLKEKLQLTHKSYEFNEFQQVPNLLELKSKFKVSYKGFKHLEPYAYAELRNCFNAPALSADYNGGKWSDYSFLGYSDCYVNRLRGSAGLEWKINRHHSIDFRYMGDWCTDKVIDTNAKGTKLKSYAWEKVFISTLNVGYKYSF